MDEDGCGIIFIIIMSLGHVTQVVRTKAYDILTFLVLQRNQCQAIVHENSDGLVLQLQTFTNCRRILLQIDN